MHFTSGNLRWYLRYLQFLETGTFGLTRAVMPATAQHKHGSRKRRASAAEVVTCCFWMSAEGSREHIGPHCQVRQAWSQALHLRLRHRAGLNAAECSAVESSRSHRDLRLPIYRLYACWFPNYSHGASGGCIHLRNLEIQRGRRVCWFAWNDMWAMQRLL
jgi:hypothetical protein